MRAASTQKQLLGQRSESFATLKTECIYLTKFKTSEEARRAIFDFIGFYTLFVVTQSNCPRERGRLKLRNQNVRERERERERVCVCVSV